MNFDDKFIEQLKSKNDIVEVVSAYCNLEQKGGAYWACCPLPGHMEKTPSFCVNQVGQFYKCFGCGRGGDVIRFIQEVESLEFLEAVKLLCDRVGLEMPTFSNVDEQKSKENKQKKERYLAILKDTAHFYVNNLTEEKAPEYIDYLNKRQIDRKTQRAFGIGASLDYTSLPKYLLEKGYSYEDMLSAGVVSYNKERGEYSDFLGKRLIIPIIDSFKNVIAFGGRVLGKTDFAKYKNTSETSLFIKNQCLYNINNLKQAKRVGGKLDFAIMVEGYMDVISLYTAGFDNVVASMGTSLTQMQAKILKRYTDNVVISYDGDAAGQNATIRGLEILRDAGLNVKVIKLPDGLDPDDVIKKHGKSAYEKLISEAKLLIDYKLDVLKSRFDTSTTSGRREFVDSAIKVIREVEKSFEQEELLKQLSQMSGIAYEYLRRDLEKLPNKTVNTQKTQGKEKEKTVNDGTVLAERFVLCALLFKKPYAQISDIESIEFSSWVREETANYIFDKTDNEEDLVPSMLFDIIGSDGAKELNEILTSGDLIFNTDAENRYYNDCVIKLVTDSLNNDINALRSMHDNEMDTKKRRSIVQIIQSKTIKLQNIKTRRIK